jgi:parallel beta-helix repeat protein
VAAPIILPVEADGTIYILADGAVNGTNKLLRDGNLYTLTDDIFDSVVIEKDNVVVDGAGYSLQGTGVGTGINLMGRTNVTVRNMTVSNFFYGVYLDSSHNNSLSNNNVTGNFYGVYLSASSNNTIVCSDINGNDYPGVWLRSSSNNEIRENRIAGNSQDGIWLSTSSDGNKIIGNTLSDNGFGIRIDDYSNNVLRNNDLRDNGCNFGVFGSYLAEFIQDIDESNTVNGKPVIYWIDRQDETVPVDAGYVALVDCSGITVQNLSLSRNGQALLLVCTTDSLITQNNLTENIHGIYLCSSSDNTVYSNNISRNAANGIYLYYSESNSFFYNNFIDNTNHVYTVGTSSNSWDNGTEGNYWTSYTGTDNNADGIGDTPHLLDGNNQDNYPLVNTIPEFPSWAILPILIAATLVAIIYRKKLRNTRQSRPY